MSEYLFNGKDSDLGIFDINNFYHFILKQKLISNIGQEFVDSLIFTFRSYNNFMIAHKNNFIQLRVVMKDYFNYVRIDTSNHSLRFMDGNCEYCNIFSQTGYVISRKVFDDILGMPVWMHEIYPHLRYHEYNCYSFAKSSWFGDEPVRNCWIDRFNILFSVDDLEEICMRRGCYFVE